MQQFILVGNPNVGKTTLYNTLTKSNNQVGNWHGITVAAATKKFSLNGQECLMHDLPGLYSLDAYSAEEVEATKFLAQHKDYVVINICDAHNLRRNLLLTMQLTNAGHKVVLAVNMASEVKGIDYNLLAKRLGICVVPIDARKKKDCTKLTEVLCKIEAGQSVISNSPKFSFAKSANGAGASSTSNATAGRLKQISDIYSQIDQVLNGVLPQQKNTYGTNKLDKIFYNKYLYLPIFICTMLLVFVITFGGVGQLLSYIVENIYGLFADFVSNILVKLNISEWAYSLIMQGVIGGVGVVISFLPQVVLMMLCINFLEDIGYLSRVAFMLNGSLKKVGLTGKSVMCLLMGYGCTTTAMLATRGLDNYSYRKRAAYLLPFASCSAKLPVYAIICSAFFTNYKSLIVFGLYLLGATIGLIYMVISAKLSKSKPPEFIMEMPPLRLPTLKKTLKNAVSNITSFVKRVGGTLVICSVVVWLLTNISFGFKFVPGGEGSILSVIAKCIAPIFAPIGLGNWGVVIALLVGMVAKEMVVSCLSITNGIVGNLTELATSLTIASSVVSFTPASAASFLVFILLYSPCITALAVAAKELGRPVAIRIFVFQFAVAYVASLVTYWLVRLGGLSFLFGAIVLALVVVCVLKLTRKASRRTIKKPKKCANCNACRL